MRHLTRWIPVAILVVALFVIGGLALFSDSEASEDATTDPAAQVEAVEGTTLSRIRLTARAAERLGIETTPVRAAPGSSTGTAATTVVPYGSVTYEADGKTWVYTSPEPLVFVRAPVRLDAVNGDLAVLSAGPPVGTAVVSVGVPELFGAEFGVGK